jgi:hypothetical protein
MQKACDLKRGSLVGIRGLPHVLENLSVSTPSARGAASVYQYRVHATLSKPWNTRIFTDGNAPPPSKSGCGRSLLRAFV